MARTGGTDRTEGLQEILESLHVLKRSVAPAHRLRTAAALTVPQWIALETIARNGSASIKDLKQALAVSSSAATQTVNELVKSGYAVRKAAMRDQRMTVVVLSSKAKRTRALIRRRVLAHLEGAFSVLSDAEFATYRRLHAKLMRAFIP